MLQKAMEIAKRALAGMTDQNGRPYIEHARRVMDRMDTEEEKTVAILHDVVEDTEMTLKDLMDEGFSRTVIDTLDQLTKRKDMTYDEYIEDISCSPLASKVKLAELEDNMDVVRVNKMSFKTYSLGERKARSVKALTRSGV